MRASVLIAGAFALFVNASPHDANKKCYNALRSIPSAKVACSSFLKTTVRPCPKTKVVTKTTTKTRKATVTTTAVTVTKTIASATTAIADENANAPLSDNNKRAAAKCPASSKPSKVPVYLAESCNSKAYSAACTAIGVKPTTTKLPARTVVTTKTVTAFVTSTAVVSATQTVTVSETQTPDVESCFYLEADASTAPGGHLFVGLSSSGFRSAIGDSLTQFRLSENGNLYTLDPDGRISMGYTRTDHGSVPHPDVDFLYFTSDFTRQSLICRIEDDQLYCDSTAVEGRTRGDMVYCSWSRGEGVAVPARAVAFTSGEVPADCKATTLKVVPCADVPAEEST